jgi:hypothetical protein
MQQEIIMGIPEHSYPLPDAGESTVFAIVANKRIILLFAIF